MKESAAARLRDGWAEVHRLRHRPLVEGRPGRRLVLWLAVIELRDAHAGASPTLWDFAVDQVAGAISRGSPVWPTYARAKRRWQQAIAE